MLMPRTNYKTGYLVMVDGDAREKRNAWKAATAAGVKVRPMYVRKADAAQDAEQCSKATGAAFRVEETIY